MSPKSAGYIQQNQRPRYVLLLQILALQYFDFLCARSTREQCGAVSDVQLGASHQILAGGWLEHCCILLSGKIFWRGVFALCCSVSWCLSAVPFREWLQKMVQGQGQSVFETLLMGLSHLLMGPEILYRTVCLSSAKDSIV